MTVLRSVSRAEGFNLGMNQGRGRRCRDPRPPPPARRAALGRRLQLHADHRPHQDHAAAARGDPGAAGRRLGLSRGCRPVRRPGADTVRGPALEGEDVRVDDPAVADLDRPAQRLVGVPRRGALEHRPQERDQRQAVLPRRRLPEVRRAVVDARSSRRCPPRTSGRRTSVGRAHSKPMPSSHDTSTTRLPGRNAARSSVVR